MNLLPSSFQAFFKAHEPMPEGAHEVLALGRQIAKEAPDFAANLIKYALNAASVKHLGFLCDQLDNASWDGSGGIRGPS